ncbi:MAG: hypothetical protein Q7J65_05465 [Candidatus Marinimicrobia bacterium]|nr:hypothetical protein [Candidatus Neomarinimicrobiota bacterium]
MIKNITVRTIARNFDFNVRWIKFNVERVIFNIRRQKETDRWVRTIVDSEVLSLLGTLSISDKIPVDLLKKMDYIPTLEQEIDSLQMVDEEIQLWLDIENFVNDITGGLAKKADIDRFILAKTNSWLTPALIACGVATYVYWRVNLCADRAYSRERSYFDGDNTENTRGDAFRHTFVSMQLRRYLTQFMAWLIMDGREWLLLDDNYAAYEMDLHNNYLGRTEKYSHFRARWFWDRYDWEKWGRRVRDYIKNQNNREYIQEWDSYNKATGEYDNPDYVAPTEPQAKDRSDNVSSWKFIYFNSHPTGNAGLEN